MSACMRWETCSRSIFAASPASSASSPAFSASIRTWSATSYNQRRAIVCAHSSRCSSTSGAHRYSEAARSNASSSASPPSSVAASSYSARAWPISFCAIDEKATSSSSVGAIPVHSESRQPTISSSSASSRSSCARTLSGFLQPRLDRVAVDAAVLEVELVRPVGDRVHRFARHEPEGLALAAPAVLLACPRLGEDGVGRLDRSGVSERLALLLLAEDLEDRHRLRSEHGVANPLLLVEEAAREVEPLLRTRTVAGDHRLELRPVGLAVGPHAVVGAPQVRVRHRQAELPDLRHVPLEELLACLLVPLGLDPPDEHRILLARNRVPVELHQRPPPPVQRFLHELTLLLGTGHHREDHVAPVEDVERLLPADLLHDPRVRRVRALEERLLADDRRRVDEPGDHPDISPGNGRVVEDVVELRLAREQVGEHLVPRLTEVLGDAVDQLRVADLVLHLRRQRQLSLQRRRLEDPLALREHAHQLRVRMHLDELDQLLPVLLRQPVRRLDLPAGLDVLEELLGTRIHGSGLPTYRSLGCES